MCCRLCVERGTRQAQLQVIYVREILSFACKSRYMSTYDLVKWARQCHSSVSVHAYDARYASLQQTTARRTMTLHVSLAFVPKDNHIHTLLGHEITILGTAVNGVCVSSFRSGQFVKLSFSFKMSGNSAAL